MFSIAVDLDNTLCETKKPNQEYIDVKPLPGAIEAMKLYESKGYKITIYTARGMASCNGDIGVINKERLPTILEWLKKYDIPFHKIVMGKVHVDYFIDDKNIEFKGNWEKVTEKLLEEENKLNKFQGEF